MKLVTQEEAWKARDRRIWDLAVSIRDRILGSDVFEEGNLVFEVRSRVTEGTYYCDIFVYKKGGRRKDDMHLGRVIWDEHKNRINTEIYHDEVRDLVSDIVPNRI